MKDFGDLHYFLGLEVQRDATGMYLIQNRYILELLNKSDMLSAKACSTPMALGKKISSGQGELLGNPTLYKSVIGGLQYLVNSRSDIAFSVNSLSQFLSKPKDRWKDVKRVLQYLKGTWDLCLHIKPCVNLSIVGFSDADWAGNPDDWRSVASWCVFLGEALVSWSSKKRRWCLALAQSQSTGLWLIWQLR